MVGCGTRTPTGKAGPFSIFPMTRRSVFSPAPPCRRTQTLNFIKQRYSPTNLVSHTQRLQNVLIASIILLYTHACRNAPKCPDGHPTFYLKRPFVYLRNYSKFFVYPHNGTC
jgi:hypothetical protein